MAANLAGQRLSGYALRRALATGIARVIAGRDEINRINVFPVPDGDTGTNLAFTLGSVLEGIQRARLASAGEVLDRVASHAVDGARGNSGAILAQFFQGVSETLGRRPRVSASMFAAAAGVGAEQARGAMAEPREGTMLSVIQAFANAWKTAIEQGREDFASSFAVAIAAAREALRRTPEQLAVLRSAGVVDAGGLGFVDLLEGVADFIARGRRALTNALLQPQGEAGVEVEIISDSDDQHRYCTECMVSGTPAANAVDRTALKAALLGLPVSSLVIAGTREKVRVHVHADDPAEVFAVAARFGRVSSQKADDMRAQTRSAHSRRAQVAIVTDSGGDLPASALERLNIHLVPVRISIGGRDYLDRVSLSSHEFYREIRESPVPPRTSQPPPGDFRRLFEFLLSHHDALIDVSLAGALSGTRQSAESAAQRVDAERIQVFDSCNGSAGQGLLAIWAAEAAAAGLGVAAILAGLTAMRPRTVLWVAVRDLSYGVRGGRAPKLALPLSRLLRFAPIARAGKTGRLRLAGGLWGRERFAERFAETVARRLDPARRYRFIVGHCDCPEDGARAAAVLRQKVAAIDALWTVEAGAGIGAHAGPGSLVIGVQDYQAPTL